MTDDIIFILFFHLGPNSKRSISCLKIVQAMAKSTSLYKISLGNYEIFYFITLTDRCSVQDWYLHCNPNHRYPDQYLAMLVGGETLQLKKNRVRTVEY